MEKKAEVAVQRGAARWQDYLQLCKPKVVMVMLVTAIVGMLMAAAPGVPWGTLLWGTLGIGMAAGSAAAVNHILDAKLDAQMRRTQARPLPQGRLSIGQAALFAALLGVTGITALAVLVNPLSAWLTLASLIGYAFVYTGYLKRATPQNIVIGGVAGAAPPLLGWVAVTGSLETGGILLMAVVFVWTPPHFWTLCLHKKSEYAQVAVPMLPVTHGEAYTRLQVTLYSILLCIVTLWPYLLEISGELYLAGLLLLNARFLYWAWAVQRVRPGAEIAAFRFSIKYILWLFGLLLADRYVLLAGG